MALPFLLAWLSLCASSFLVVKAQYTLAQCDPPGDYTWMENSKGHSPCLIAAYLLVPCVGPVHAEIPGLNDPDTTPGYGGPTQSTLACGCNTVMYALLQACTACQPGGYRGVLRWSEYSANCTDPTLLSYPNPIPPGTAIPAWAFQDVRRTDKFDPVKAALTGDTPESSASPSSTTATFSATLGTMAASSSSSPPSSTSSGAPTSPTAGTSAESGDGQGKSSNVGAIAGGAVGGMLGLLLLGSAIIYMLLRQRRLDRKTEAHASERPMSEADEPSEKPMSIMSVPSMIYDPDDPRTFPAATNPSPFGMRAASPTPSVPPGSIAGHMHSFSALQSYTAPGYNGSENGHGHAGSTYRGTPEV